MTLNYNTENLFTINRFSSGEWDVAIDSRINKFHVNWNWFKEPDVMIPLMKADAIRRQYDDCELSLFANYLPYSRQDRVFQVGGSNGISVLRKILEANFSRMYTMGFHSRHAEAFKNLFILSMEEVGPSSYEDTLFVFPDENAVNHYTFIFGTKSEIIYKKSRNEDGITVEEKSRIIQDISKIKKIIIMDDICDGGRTFCEVAKKLSLEFPCIPIYITVYHAFLSHGLGNLKASGIQGIRIINPESLDYVISQYPSSRDFFVDNFLGRIENV